MSAPAFIDDVNSKYEVLHKAFEEQFWGTKMALSDGKYNTAELTRTKGEMEGFLADPANLARARELLAQARAACEQAGGPTDEQASLLELVAGRVSTAAAPRPPPRPPPAAASARPIGGAPTTGWDANLASDASVDDLNFPGTIAAP